MPRTSIWDWNFKTNEVFFSTRWKEMLGYKDHEISNCWDESTKRIHPDERDLVVQAFQDHFAKKTPFYVCEYRVQCQDGSYKWILDRGQALWDALGDMVRMVGSYTDITNRQLTEEELKWQIIAIAIICRNHPEDSRIFTRAIADGNQLFTVA